MRVCPNCERVVIGEHCTCFADGQQVAPKPDDAVARARRLWQGIAWRDDLDAAGIIAAALRAERTRALEDAANACDRFAKALPHSLEVIVHDLAIEIRALKDRP